MNPAALDRDLAAMTADLPVIVTIGGAPFTVDATDETLTQNLEAAGYSADYDAEFTVRISVLAMPAAGTRLTHNGRSYKVLRTQPSVDGVSYRLQVKEASAR
jgi:hypothetical protein